MLNPMSNPSAAFMAYLLHLNSSNDKDISDIMRVIGVNNRAELDIFLALVDAAREQLFNKWLAYDVRHTIAQVARSSQKISQFDLFAALYAGVGGRPLSQDQFDFLTLRDVDSAFMEMAETPNSEKLKIDAQEQALAKAFRQQVIDEAECANQMPVTGAFILMREPLAALDELLLYDHLRLIIRRDGMFCSVVTEGNQYVTFYWSPVADQCFSLVYASPRTHFALDVMLASIWRDAHVVEERFTTKTKRKWKRPTRPYRKSRSAVRLPRTIHYVQWGNPDDRAEIARREVSAHLVRGMYRNIGPEFVAGDEAIERARAYGFLPPPKRYTFVKPHTRGKGEVSEKGGVPVRRVVCTGLQTARLLLGNSKS